MSMGGTFPHEDSHHSESSTSRTSPVSYEECKWRTFHKRCFFPGGKHILPWRNAGHISAHQDMWRIDLLYVTFIDNLMYTVYTYIYICILVCMHIKIVNLLVPFDFPRIMHKWRLTCCFSLCQESSACWSHPPHVVCQHFWEGWQLPCFSIMWGLFRSFPCYLFATNTLDIPPTQSGKWRFICRDPPAYPNR